MEERKLLEILTLVGGVESHRWQTVRDLVEFLNKEEHAIVKATWYDEYKNRNPQYYPLNLLELDTWSTHEPHCIDIDFRNVNGEISCIANIYKGNSFNGEREERKFTAELKLPGKFATIIKNIIESRFTDYLEDEYDKYLDQQRTDWINAKRSEILSR